MRAWAELDPSGLEPHEVDEPIAICEQSIRDPDTGAYTCNIGRMINSGQSVSTSNTGGWTSFSQNSPCLGGASGNDVISLLQQCGNTGNQNAILPGPMATNGGEISAALMDLYKCWQAATGETKFWNLTLPVVNCASNNVGTCEDVVGSVNLNIVWITGQGDDPTYSNAPKQMEDWSDSNTDGSERWANFVNHFNLLNVDGSPAPYQKMSIYFLPDCSEKKPEGATGGQNFGVHAKYPVLVQ